jgi:hypothetical protein
MSIAPEDELDGLKYVQLGKFIQLLMWCIVIV